MTEHSVEPWHLWEHELRTGDDKPLPFYLYGIESPWGSGTLARVNARRAVQCVNACAGMDDPAMAVSDLRAAAEHLEAAKALAATLYYETCRYRDEHPPHSPLDEMHRGQQNAAYDLLKAMCGGDHAEIVRVCDPFEEEFLARRAHREAR